MSSKNDIKISSYTKGMHNALSSFQVFTRTRDMPPCLKTKDLTNTCRFYKNKRTFTHKERKDSGAIPVTMGPIWLLNTLL